MPKLKKIRNIVNKTIIQNLGLAAASFFLCLFAIVVASKLYASRLGIHDPSFRYESKINMWQSEPAIGFINKPHFSGFSFGCVHVQTNEWGFRGSGHTLLTKREGVVRIVSMGDSVMWGVGVNKEDSIPGLLEKDLNNDSLYEVINASVVGYSTYQELLYLTKYVLPLKPDVVLVNYCLNDVLPTEDPFKNVRAIHIRYLNHILGRPDLAFTPEEKAGIQKLIHIFGSAKHIWNTWDALHTREPNLFHLARKVFIEIPVAEMAELSRESGVRLIYVFIPPRSDRTEYACVADKLQKLLVQRGAEFLDLQSALVPSKNELTRPMWMNVSRFGWIRPREFKEILILRSMRTVHNRDIYFDSVHPTKKGNAIIAEHIYRYLTETSTVKETDMPK